ncbi:MAG: alpha/beta hydrolase, partial [Gammaproteobacteria bacterium]
MRGIKRALLFSLIAIVAACTTLIGAGIYLTRPHHNQVGPPPPGLQLRTVSIPASDGTHLSAWYRPSSGHGASVLLLHGVGADRRSMLGQARFLIQQGYGVLMPDLRAHGESGGERVTLGWREAGDVQAAFEWLEEKDKPCAMGLIGFSLGAVAATLSESRDRWDALILEAMFPNLEDAVANRLEMRLGAWARSLSPLLLVQTRWYLGVGSSVINPAKSLVEIKAPVLLIG